ncbi:hypothetical protein PV328_011918, partial [Microctonus aethiopoides]
MEEFIGNSIVAMTLIGVCLKINTIVERRDTLSSAFALLFRTEIYRIKCEETKKFDIEGEKKSRLFAQSYGILMSISAAIMICSALMNISARVLPFNGWFPFKYDDTISFFVIFTYQIIIFIYVITIGPFTDTVICGGMIHCSNHLKILRYDIEYIVNYIKKYSTESNNFHETENIFIKNCIQYHLLIFEFSRRFNDIFSSVIFFQFSISTLTLCTSVQTLTTLSFMSSEFITVTSYVACMLAQIFVLCWYANEVTLNSLSIRTAVYNMDWYSLSLKTQTNLLLIIARASYPITFTGGPFVTLSLDSFVN